MSSLTQYEPIPDGSEATPGLFDTRFSALHQNLATLDSALSQSLTSATGVSGISGTPGAVLASAPTGNVVLSLAPEVLLTAGRVNFRGPWCRATAASALPALGVVAVTAGGMALIGAGTIDVAAPVPLFLPLAAAASGSASTFGAAVAEVGGFASLTTGATYWLSTESGSFSTTPPAGCRYRVGVALSASTLLFAPSLVGPVVALS